MSGQTGSVRSLIAQAQALLDARRPHQAIVVLLQACALDPTGATPRCLASTAYLQLRQHKDALAAADDAIRVAPASDWAHRLRALALSRLKRREALVAANNAIRLAPLFPESYLVLAEVEAARHHWSAAWTAAQRAVTLAPERASGHVALSMVAIRSQRWTDAETHARAALAIEPENTAAMNNLGLALRATGRKREAVHYLGTASSLDPRNPLYHRNALRAANWYWGAAALVAVAVFYLAIGDIAAGIGWIAMGLAVRVLFLARRGRIATLWRTPIAWLRRRRSDAAPDPKASPELMAELRRQNFPAAGRVESAIRRVAQRLRRPAKGGGDLPGPGDGPAGNA